MDLFFDERRIEPLKAFQQDAAEIRRSWMERLLPGSSDDAIAELLAKRRFVILEGPPGTGKTELAGRLLRSRYSGRGRVIQFHPGTTYESFLGGLAPRDGGALGFTFQPAAGHLMEAAAAAARERELTVRTGRSHSLTSSRASGANCAFHRTSTSSAP